MSVEENKAIVRRFWEEGMNKNDASAMGQILAPDAVLILGEAVVPFQGIVGMMRSAFPDLQDTIDEVIAEGDSVMVRITRTGTHRGTYTSPVVGAVAPTGKKAKWTAIFTFRIGGGKITEVRGYVDQTALLQQLGAIPAPAGR